MSTIESLVKTKILRAGMSGPDVRELQLALAKLGYPLSGTGNFSTKTDSAVESFQRSRGLDPDGDVGTLTARAIDNALAAPRAAIPAGQAAAPLASFRPLWLQYSIDHIGTKEAPGAANNKQLVHDIQAIAPDYTADSIPWCAGWVSLCLTKDERKTSKSPLWARSYAEDWGVKLIGPAVGAIAVKTRTGGGHVTFVAGRTASGLLACCGGNQNDAVNIAGYDRNSFNLGFFWPKDAPMPDKIGFSTLPIVNAAGKVTSEA